MGQVNAYAYGANAQSAYGGGAPSSMLHASGAHLQMGGGMDFVPPEPEQEAGRCHHRKADGEFCGRFPKKGSDFCPLHKRVDEAANFLNEVTENQES